MSLKELESLTPIQVLLLEALYNGIPLIRDDFVKKLNRARTTIYNNLETLEKKNLVIRYNKNNGQGRPLTLWHLTRNPLHELFKKNEKRPDFIQNKDPDKKIFKKYKKSSSLRYAQKKRLQKTINDKIRPQTRMDDYIIKNRGKNHVN